MVYINFPTTIKGITFQKDFLINDLHTLKLDMFVKIQGNIKAKEYEFVHLRYMQNLKLVTLLSIIFFITYDGIYKYKMFHY